MLDIPAVRWGQPYESLEKTEIVHFETGQPIARMSLVNGGIVARDLRRADQARKILQEIDSDELLQRVAAAADLFESATLTLAGGGEQSPDAFARQQAASTGLPEHLCRANVRKNSFVLRNMRAILDALTRGLDLKIFSRGYGVESRGVVVSYQCQSPVLGAVLPNNSPGVHTLWLPVIPLQVGLALKPGTQEPWTAYRIAAAFSRAGIPPEAIALYPGGHDVGAAILAGCGRSMMFGSAQTIAQYAGNPRVQVHGPGFSKIFLGDDCVDEWERYLDLMVESIVSNAGRSCINASGVWASRHTREIAAALAERLGPIEPRPSDDPQAALAAFTVSGQGAAIWQMLHSDLQESGVTHCTEAYGPRLVEREHCAYLRPVIAHADSPHCAIASKEFMFPMATVVQCPQDAMIAAAGPTLVCTAITNNPYWTQQLVAATSIDRLNLGPIATNRLNWLQPHEGNLIDFLFRSRAVQLSADKPSTVEATA